MEAYASQSKWIDVKTDLEAIKQKMRDNMINPNLTHGIQFCLGLLDDLSPFNGQKNAIWNVLTFHPLATGVISKTTNIPSKNVAAILNQMRKTNLIGFTQKGKLKSWYRLG